MPGENLFTESGMNLSVTDLVNGELFLALLGLGNEVVAINIHITQDAPT